MAWTPVNDGQTPNWSTGGSIGQFVGSVFGFGPFCSTPISGAFPAGDVPWNNVNDSQTPNWSTGSVNPFLGQAADSSFGFGAFSETPLAGSFAVVGPP